MTAPSTIPQSSVGLGLRRALLTALEAELAQPKSAIDFVELAPENWLDVGGRFGASLERIATQKPIIAHGLSLSLGGTDSLDVAHLQAIRAFLDRFNIDIYSEHLSATAIDGHLYDLAPLPFTDSMVRHLAQRIGQTQDILGRRIAVENSSYYLNLSDANTELQFLNAVLAEVDCDLLLDVNNVYVNSQNHGYSAQQFIAGIDPSRVRYLHIAGHDAESDAVIVDTHGADVCEPVWDLLKFCYQHVGVRPTLIERDFNMPAFSSLLGEVRRAQALVSVMGAQHG
jgi:uncharacterized protein